MSLDPLLDAAGDLPTLALCTYASPRGPRAGVLIDGVIRDAADALGDPRYACVRALLGDWPTLRERLAVRTEAPGVADATDFLPAVPDPSAIFCAGANYGDHVREMAGVLGIPEEPDPHEAGLEPWHFLKAPACLAGHGDTIVLPPWARDVDWEAELAAVIGPPARNVAREDALAHVAAYTVANDLSSRDHLKRAGVPDLSPFKYDWISSKCWDGALPLGPFLVPADRIADPQDLAIRLSVNGTVLQDSHTGQMLFTLAEQIAHLSTRVTLRTGDVVLTGTPAGVGMARGVFLRDGDVVEVTVAGLGTLRNAVRRQDAV